MAAGLDGGRWPGPGERLRARRQWTAGPPRARRWAPGRRTLLVPTESCCSHGDDRAASHPVQRTARVYHARDVGDRVVGLWLDPTMSSGSSPVGDAVRRRGDRRNAMSSRRRVPLLAVLVIALVATGLATTWHHPSNPSALPSGLSVSVNAESTALYCTGLSSGPAPGHVSFYNTATQARTLSVTIVSSRGQTWRSTVTLAPHGAQSADSERAREATASYSRPRSPTS